MRQAHPDEYNQSTRSGRTGVNPRSRWTDDERNVLAALEAEAKGSGLTGTMETCRYLAEKHGGRTLNGIRGERNGLPYLLAYRQQLSDLLGGSQDVPISATATPSAVTDEQDHSDVESPSTEQCVSTADKSSDVEVVFECNRDVSQVQVEYDPCDELRGEIEAGIDFVGAKRKFLASGLVRGARAVLENRSDLGPMMEWFAEMVGPKRQPRRGMGAHGPNTVRGTRSRREESRTEYAKLQTLFRRAPRKAAKCILEGSKDVKSGPKGKAMFKFWENVFSTEGTTQVDEMEVESEGPVVSDESVKAICGPIRLGELAGSKPKRGTAAGPDGLSATRWRVVPEEWKLLFYNSILYAEELPAEFVAARTVFIPKVDEPRLPSEYRPISVTSVALRQLHTILARRLQHAFAHDERQRAFRRSVDGSAENVLLLNAILGDARDKRRELHLVSLDLNKAFDSVHHKSILSTLKHLGCPTRLINHVRRVYSGATTNFQFKGQEYHAQVKRGVLQGDPMSPILFNYIIDGALARINNSLGYSLGNRRISAIAFADDIILVSGTVQGLQRNLDSVVGALAAHGLSVNVRKTTTLSCEGVSVGGSRRMAIGTAGSLNYENLPIRQLGPTDDWRYLGTHFRGANSCGVMPTGLIDDIEKVSRAKLKPQQKLLLLRQFVLTKWLHELVLGKTSQKMLRGVDKVIRKFTRKWLHFPKDVPNAYIHCAHRHGGLGVFSLELGIPRMRLCRIQAFIDRDSAMARVFAGSNFAHKQIKVCKATLRKAGVIETTKQAMADNWKTQLEARIDTAGLTQGDPVSHEWLKRYGGMSGGEFVRLNHVRAGCLPTTARLTRGREGDTRCRGGCEASESNYHVIQQCEKSKGGVRIRHNKVVKLLEEAISANATVNVEPRFETTDGLKIPDLIAVRNRKAWVLDVQVVNDDDMSRYHLKKAQKYQSCPGMDRQICWRYGCAEVKHIPITVSYKGVIHCETAGALRRDFSLSESILGRVTLLVLRGSYSNWARLRARFWNVIRRSPDLA